MMIFILFIMIFCHIVDDYYLQGILAQLKQKTWWKENYPDKKYKYDYLVALWMHSFSWTFSILLAPFIYHTYKVGYAVISSYLTLFFVNMIIHATVDDMKANQRTINLVCDQLIHVLMIIISWFAYMVDIFIYT